ERPPEALLVLPPGLWLTVMSMSGIGSPARAVSLGSGLVQPEVSPGGWQVMSMPGMGSPTRLDCGLGLTVWPPSRMGWLRACASEAPSSSCAEAPPAPTSARPAKAAASRRDEPFVDRVSD